MATTTDSTDSGNRTAERSSESVEFEAFWKMLPRHEALPHKSDFRPVSLGQLLPFVILTEARMDPVPSLLVRVVGSAVEARIRRDIRGHDWFEFVRTDRRDLAARSLELMLERPCGLWQIMPLHYERGIAQIVEATVFPLLGETNPFLLSLVIPREEPVPPISPGERAILADAATQFQFLDIGGGVPPWSDD